MKFKLTFKQREGIEPPPRPLDKTDLPKGLRNGLYNIIYDHIDITKRVETDYRRPFGNSIPILGKDWKEALLKYHCCILQKPLDEFDDGFENNKSIIKKVILDSKWCDVLELIDCVVDLKKSYAPHEILINSINKQFEKHLYPYRIIEKMVVPVLSEQEANTIKKAFEDTQKSKLYGAEKHLKKSIKRIKSEEYGNSISESIHAVESVAQIITGQKKATLGEALSDEALDFLEDNEIIIHGALKSAFKKLYGYTSDEKGIRHADNKGSYIDQDKSNIQIEEAQFMLGACSAFVSYLIAKNQKITSN